MEGKKEIKTIKVGGKTYATGLFWQPLQSQKEYLNEIKSTVQNVVTGANLFCLRKGSVSQYGLGYTSMGHKSGMPSAASIIANVFRDKASALCAFKIKEGWWFTVIRNNLIISEEDTVYTEEEDVRNAFEAMLDIPDWGYIVAPTEWGYEGSIELKLENIIVKGQAVELKRIQTAIKPTDLLIIFALIAAGYYYYSKQQAEKEEQERQIRITQEKARQARLNPPPPPPPPPAPFESLLDPEDMTKKCTILIVNSTATIPGWRLENSSCSETQMVSNWKRTYGSAGWIFEAQRLGIINKNIKLTAKETGYNNIMGTLDIPIMKHISVKPTLTKFELQKDLNSIFHDLKINDLKLENGKITLKDANNPSYIMDYPYTEFKFSDTTYRMPLDWVKKLDKFKTISFSNILWNNSTRKWNYSGRIYELSPKMIQDIEDAKKKELEKAEKEKKEKELQTNSNNKNNEINIEKGNKQADSKSIVGGTNENK